MNRMLTAFVAGVLALVIAAELIDRRIDYRITRYVAGKTTRTGW